MMMHLKANNAYKIEGFIYNNIIPSFSSFVYLFMVISAFGMCCGYYNKIIQERVDFSAFYKKRYIRILPFFSVLVVIDLIMNFSWRSVAESIADVTLTFGLFPNDIEIVGVGWFLGLVFAFYLIFPFYCTLISSKGKARLSLVIAIILNLVLDLRFEVGSNNIIYSLCFFILGGIMYQYRGKLEKTAIYLTLPIVILSIVILYVIGKNTFTILLASGSMLALAISNDNIILNNPFTKFISDISMEIYLSHMVIFRGMEKLKLNVFIDNDIIQYIFTSLCCFILTVAFSFILKKLLLICTNKFVKG